MKESYTFVTCHCDKGSRQNLNLSLNYQFHSTSNDNDTILRLVRCTKPTLFRHPRILLPSNRRGTATTCVDRMVWNGYSRDPDYFDFKYSFHSSVASKRIAKSGWLPSFIQNNDTRTASGRVFFQQKRNWKCVPPKSNLNAKKKLMAKPSDGNIYYLFPYTSKFQASPLDSLHLSPPQNDEDNNNNNGFITASPHTQSPPLTKPRKRMEIKIDVGNFNLKISFYLKKAFLLSNCCNSSGDCSPQQTTITTTF